LAAVGERIGLEVMKTFAPPIAEESGELGAFQIENKNR
jgi:hypothetical protein